MAVAVGIAGIAVAGYGIYSGNKAAKDAAGRQDRLTAEQKMLDAEHARNIKIQAAQEAQKVRASAVQIRGKQIASQASSGVLVGDGSTHAMVDETLRLAEQDAWIIIYNGNKGYLKSMADGKLAQQAGQAQSSAYRDQARATTISGFGSLLSQTSSVINTYNNQPLDPQQPTT